MASSSSSSQHEGVLPLIPCPDCKDKVVTYLSHAGSRFYKCARKDAGLCGFIRSTDTYLLELTRAGLSQPYALHSTIARHSGSPLQMSYRRGDNFQDRMQPQIHPPQVHMEAQMQHQSPPRAAHPCCSADSHRTALLAGTNFILVVALVFLIFQQSA